MRLSPVDHVFTGRGGYPINFLFSYSGSLDSLALKTSLEECLSFFMPLRSVLKNSTPNTLEFFESKASLAWHEQKLNSEVDFNDLQGLDPLLSRAQSVPDKPLIEVTLSYTPSKSYLGVSISHCVVDGFSYFLFLSIWSKIHRKLDFAKPFIDRSFLNPKNFDSHKNYDDSEILQCTGFSLSKIARPGNDDRVNWEIIDFKKNELDKLYNEVAATSEMRLSINDVLSAHLWKKIVAQQSKNLGPEAQFTLSCAFDYRRVFPNIHPLYFGNAIRAAYIQMEATRVLESKLSDLAIALSRAVKSIDAEAALDSLKCLENIRLNNGLEIFENFHVADPETGFLVTNLSRLPILDLDFGQGAPEDFRILTPARNTAVILPHTDGLRIQIAR